MQNVAVEPTPPKQPEQIDQVDPLARSWNIVFWGTVAILVLVLVAGTIMKPFAPEQFIVLARNFVAGRVSADDMPLDNQDYAIWQGHIYLALGPLPAVVLIPFLPLFKLGLLPGWVSILFTGLNVWLFYLICGELGILGEKRRWALLLFFGGTVYFAMAATMLTWYFAHVVATTCLLACILETVGRKRPFIIGLLLGLGAATRVTLVFSLPFILFFFWPFSSTGVQDQKQFHQLRRISILFMGLAIPLALILVYNYARFGNVLETGYGFDVLGSPDLAQYRNYGLFNIVHIPTNLYYLLVQGPLPYPAAEAPIYTFPYLQPSPMGMAVFYTSPALLYVFRAKLNAPVVTASWLAIAAILVPLMTYYATGWITFGDRYTLDFMPFMVLIAAYGFPKRLNNWARGLVIMSVLVNLWGNYWLHSWLYKPA